MTIWMIRAKEIECEDFALENNVASIGWPWIQHDLSTIRSRDELRELLDQVYSVYSTAARGNWLGQLSLLLFEMKPGNMVTMPLFRQRPYVAIGEIASYYYYAKDNPIGLRHLLKVKGWKEIPRSHFEPDLLEVFNAPVTIRLIKKDRAEERVREMLRKNKV
jgi:predicted Mrr-cat superfamily restriction endonuclease